MPVLARYYRARSGKVHRVDFTRQALACGAGHRDMTPLDPEVGEGDIDQPCHRCFPRVPSRLRPPEPPDMVLPEREGWPAHTEGQRYVADRYGVVWLLVPQYDEGMATTSDATGIWSVGINVLQSERGPLRLMSSGSDYVGPGQPPRQSAPAPVDEEETDFERARREYEAQWYPDTITIRRPQIYTGPKDMTVDEATVHYLRDATKRVHENRYWGSGVTDLVAGILKAVADEIDRTS